MQCSFGYMFLLWFCFFLDIPLAWDCWIIGCSCFPLKATAYCSVRTLTSVTSPSPHRLCFFPGPLHQCSLKTYWWWPFIGMKWALIVVWICMALKTGKFKILKKKKTKLIKLTCWNWLLESGPCVEFFWLPSSGRLVTVCVICRLAVLWMLCAHEHWF